ncbi:MAG: hypothetical protein KKH28_11145, partial [Elusimicrobia bacterium]|nr:hypothetical protein [Elusimicrobiota bacterium]
MKPNSKKPDLQKVMNVFSVCLAFMALAVNVAVSWKMYHALPVQGAAGYKAYAWAYGRFTEPIGVREPAPVFAVKALSGTGLAPALSAKVLGLAAFAALTALTFLLLKRRYGTGAGAVGALFLGANPYFSFYAMKGPAEIFPILFFLVFWQLAERGGVTARNLVMTAVFAALAALSKILFLLFVFFALAAGIFKERSRQRLKFNVRALLLCCAFVSPYFIYQAAVFSGPLSLQQNTLRHWRNMELHGPALEAPFDGGPLGPAGFIFAGGPARSAARFGGGLKKIFLSGLPKLAYCYKLELFFGLIGLVLLFIKREWLYVSLFFVFILPAAFIASINQAPAYWGIEPRFYLPAFWLICVYAGYGFHELLILIADLLKAKILKWSKTQ